MSRLKIDIVPVASLGEQDRRTICQVFGQGFDHERDAEACLRPYFEKVHSMCLGRDGGRIIGFQFYQEKVVAGRTVHHFSLASRLPDRRYRGLQAQFGAALIKRAIARVLPWKPVYLAGVTNSPKSYANMHAVGGKCYPDVLQPAQANPFGAWYAQVAEHLQLAPVEANGLLRNRMQGLGFSMQAERFDNHPLGRAYGAYVEDDIRHGIFTLVEIVPLRDLPSYLFKRAFGRRRTPAIPATTSP